MLYHVNVCMCARMHAAEHILKLLRRDQNVCVPLQEWQAAGYTRRRSHCSERTRIAEETVLRDPAFREKECQRMRLVLCEEVRRITCHQTSMEAVRRQVHHSKVPPAVASSDRFALYEHV
jgi:hypothetical protein